MAAVPVLAGVSAVSAGYYFTSARKSVGEVWSWGNGTSGQLGDGTGTTIRSPVRTSLTGVVARLAAGHSHGIAVTSNGIVFTWGLNSNNQLGDGTNANRLTPVAISDIDYQWKVATPSFSVPAGTYYTNQTVVITDATAGAGIHYTLNGNDPALTDPVVASGGSVLIDRLETLKAKAWKTGMPASSIAAALYSMTVQTPAGSPFAGTFTTPQTVTLSTTTPGATLRYTTDGVTTPVDPGSPLYTAPLSIGTTTTLKVKGFKSGWTSSAVLTATYRMNFGTLAPPAITPAAGTYTSSVTVTLASIAGATMYYTTNGTTPSQFSTVYTAPFAVASTLTVRAIAMHPDYTTSAVGSSAYTIAVAAPVFSPVAGTYAAGQAITVTSATTGATIRYTVDGRDPTDTDTVIASGGTLVIGNYTLKARASKTGATTSGITTAVYQVSGQLTNAQVDGGDDRSILVRPDGVPWTWGWQSGNGSHAGSWVPMEPAGITGVKSVSGGGQHTLLSVADGSVYAWGWNTNGQLGDATTTLRLTPVRLTTITTVTKVSAGGSHSLALKQDGTVWTWGSNTYGQLGDNTLVQKTSPVSAGLSSMVAVAAGRQFSLALKSTGRVYAWGDNAKGQLGDGTTIQRKVPVQVSGITTAVAIAAGDSFALALLANGTMVAWGDNWAGQLGNGSSTQSNTPVAVAGLTSVTAIAAGGGHSLAVKSNGSVWSWGNGNSGQLGYTGSYYGSQLTPAQVPGLSGITAVGAGMAHSLAVATDGTVWAWGYNYYGQLGDATATTRLAPVRISGPGFLWKVWGPLVTPGSGTYNVPQTATVTSQDPNATLHYTLTGADPVEADPVITSGGTLPIDQSLTLRVNAWKPGAPTSEVTSVVYELKALAPAIAPITGNYSGPITVTLTSGSPASTIRYTLDGTEPTPASPVYSAAITVAHTATLKAKAYKTGWTTSDGAFASYWITEGTVATPQVTPPAGAYTDVQLVRLTSDTEGATIRYTLDGSDPTERSPLYRFGFLVPATTTVKARAFKIGLTGSAITTAAFVLDAAGAALTPTLVPAGGRFTVRQTVTVLGPAGATLRYTVDGRDPADTDPAVGPAGTILVDRSQVLKVRAWQDGLAVSATRSAFFVITGAVSAGHAHTLALKSDGTVWSWGHNGFGALGDGSTTTRDLPVQVGISEVQAIAAGYYHSLALKRDGTVWGWGYNSCGQAGGGNTNQQNLPVAVPGLTDVVAIAAGGANPGFIFGHSLALKADGTVWAWGCNWYGQLGDGTTTPRTTPVQVVGLRGVSAIAVAGDASFAIEAGGASGGSVWGWGYNSFGELGDGSTVSPTVPVRLPAITDAVDVTGNVALRRDGTLWTWGPATPSPFPLLQSVFAISSGWGRFALTTDGARWAWGYNFNGMLGNNFACSYVPECLASGRVIGVPADIQVAVGTLHSVMLRTDGTVAAAGYNSDGELGNGTRTDSPVPVVVPGLSLATNAWLATDDDYDGLNAWREWLAGTDPYRADTNGNGIFDGMEEGIDSSALNPDTDGDGLSNAAEVLLGTDPYIPDTDGDGVVDGLDGFPLDPTRSSLPPPDPLDTTPPIIILKQPTTARPVGGGGL
jgi:alpha-tubulin suppressor-like RCC1 family protein